jgi:hypothetical protein
MAGGDQAVLFAPAADAVGEGTGDGPRLQSTCPN